GFRHPDLLAWVREQRPRLVVAALTILRAYFVAGRPDMGCKRWGSFEAWSRLVANCLVWLGMADPQNTRFELEEQGDRVRHARRALLFGWKKMQDACSLPDDEGLTIGQVLRLLYPAPTREPRAPEAAWCAELRDTVEAIAPPVSPGKPPSAQKLGMHLHHAR